jgi:hypothetical protein
MEAGMPEAARALEDFQDVFCDPRTGKAQVKEHKQAPAQWVSLDELPYYPFVSINRDSYQVVHLDVDDPGCCPDPIIPPYCDIGPYEWHEVPFPNWTIESSSLRYHAIWILERSLPFSASCKSLQFFHDARLKLAYAFGGDPSCSPRPALRNPVYKKGRSQCFTKERRQLSEITPRHITIPARTFRNYSERYEKDNRNNCTFWVLLRRFKEYGESLSPHELFDYAVRFQDQCNADPLPRGENWQIAKSVCRNGHNYRVSADRRYGAMGLDPAPWDEMSDEERKAEIKRRQRLGIQYVNDQRKSKTRAKLEVAVQELQREGEKITQRAVAARSGCAIQTVNSHWPSLF